MYMHVPAKVIFLYFIALIHVHVHSAILASRFELFTHKNQFFSSPSRKCSLVFSVAPPPVPCGEAQL